MKLSNSISNKNSPCFSEEKKEDIFDPSVVMPIVPPFAEILDELKGLEEGRENETAFEKIDLQRRELKRKSEGQTSAAKKQKPNISETGLVKVLNIHIYPKSKAGLTVYISLDDEKFKDKLTLIGKTAENLPLPGRKYTFRYTDENIVENFS